MYWGKKIFLYTAFIVIAFGTLSFLILQFPEVQTALTSRYLSGFSEIVGFPATIEKMDLRWYDRLDLTNVNIKDPEGNNMISVGKLSVNFGFLELLQNGNVNIDEANIDKAEVSLIKIAESDTSKNLNINVFIKKINEKFSSGKGGGGSAKLNLREINLDHSHFLYNDTEKDSIKNGFDYNHFRLTVDKGSLEEFQIIGDTIQFDVNTLQVQDQQTGFKIKELSTYFRISQSSMEFLNVDLKANNSHISDTIIFTYQSQDDLSDFNDKVNIKAKLKGIILDPKDLALFTYGLSELPLPVMLSGNISGKVSRFNFRNMDVALGNTRIAGRLRMEGLPNINETFIDLKINEGTVHQNDIRFMMPENIFELIQPLGHTQLQAEFTGFVNDFVSKGSLNTSLGQVKSDVNLKVNEKNVGESTYSGKLALTNFQLGKYLNDTINFQQTTLNGRIRGKGLTRETADFILAGEVNSFGFRNYNYSGIATDAQFASQLFNGNISINDPNLKFNATGFIDFRKGKELINVKATLDTAYIDRLGFIKDPLFVRSYFDVNTTGLKLDSLFGSVVLRNTFVNYNNNVLTLDSVHLTSTQDGPNRNIKLLSSIADLTMKGNYHYASLYNDLLRLSNEFYLSLVNDRKGLEEYHAKKQSQLLEPYQCDFAITLHNIKPLALLGNLPLFISPGALVTGKYINNGESNFKLFAKADTVAYQGKVFSTNEIKFSANKPTDSLKGKSSLLVRSSNQKLSNSFKTKDLLVEAQWNKEHVDFDFRVDQDGNTNILRMKSGLDYLKDSIQLKILSTQLRIFDEYWAINPENFIRTKGREWHIHQMRINHEQESVLLDGLVSELPEKTLTLTIDSLNIDLLNSLLHEKISGIVNGTVQSRDFYHSPFVQNNLSVTDFTVDDFLVGDIKGLNQWNRDRKRFDLNFTLERNKKRTVEMKGFYDPANSNPLWIDAKLENTNIKIIEPFLRGIFSEMDGALTGNYTVTGTFTEPKVEGEGKIESAQLMVDYLKTKYTLSGSLLFTPDQIQFKNFKLRDDLKNNAALDGYIAHRNFNDMRINIDATFNKFQLMNTTAKDNDLFYGQAYGTGNMKMIGSINNLKISGTTRSDKGTRILIPLGGTTETVAKKDFVTFVNFSDTLKLKKEKRQTKIKNELSGITMDLNLDITPDAYAEMIFDIRSGDIIRGYGRGNLKLQFDTKGDFNMFGNYEFEQGYYNFTLYDIINKEFSINKGSRIAWYGDPYSGILNLTASYRQLVSLAPVITNQDPTVINSIPMRRKYPVEVQLKLDGAMMSPQINFDIVANDLPNTVPVTTTSGTVAVTLNNDFKAFRAQLNNEQEMKRQVFSLIMLRRFSPQDAFATGGSLQSSVSELFSNQLSYWLTQVDQNLEVNFDLGNFDQEAFNTFQLRLSYSFLNGRLRVTRDGAFNNQYTRSEVANMLGDWTIDYLLTPDGKFKVKMYSRNNINQLLNTSTFNSQTAITTGVSLMNTQNFNTWRELLTSARERRRKELEKQKAKKEEEEDGTN